MKQQKEIDDSDIFFDRMAGEWVGLAEYDVFLREVGAAINAACVAEAVYIGMDPWHHNNENPQTWTPEFFDQYQFGDDRA